MRTLQQLKRAYKTQRERPQLWWVAQSGFGYIQIPKIASRNLRTSMLSFLVEQGLIDAQTDDLNQKQFMRQAEKLFSAHLSHQEIANRAKQGGFIFAFVRNPFERIYSCYRDKILRNEAEGLPNILDYNGFEFGMSFADFVKRCSQVPDKKINRHLRAQHWFLTHNNQLLPHFVGKLETLDDDFAEVEKRCKLPAPPRRYAYNSPISLTENFDEELADIVRKRYAQDFQLFNYSLDLAADPAGEPV